jgi:hypothetical protein
MIPRLGGGGGETTADGDTLGFADARPNASALN